MTEQEILNKIRKSAESAEIPKTLKPEEVKKMLDQKAEETPSVLWKGEDEKMKKRFKRGNRRIVAAAVMALVAAAFSAGVWHINQSGTDVSRDSKAGYQQLQAQDIGSWEGGGQMLNPKYIALNLPKKDAGTLYTVAESYEEIYELLAQEEYNYWYGRGMLTDGAVVKGIPELEQNLQSAEIFSSAASEKSVSVEAAEDTAGEADYSTTNLQTEGVDESDIVKTNGKYIFTASGSKVVVTDVQGDMMKIAGEIAPELDSAADDVLEMYVDSRHLVLITQHYDASLRENWPGESSTEESESIAESAMLPLENSISADSQYYIESKCNTVVYTYDITAPETPKLLGKMEQDGYYQTSRKIGDMVYLFTNQGLWDTAYRATNEQRTKGGFLPLVNGEEIPYDSVYLPKQGGRGLIVSSVDLGQPDTVLDKTMIIHNYVQVYVSTESVYLYYSDYEADKTLTQIAKFTLKDGRINATGAVSVEGEIYDTFAINEKDGKLRVLTTVNTGGERSNSLFLFNEDLDLTGSITDIAKGEQIYAARYLGDMAYFITYRNTDPLFAVDLSDEKNPKILGELEVTGFSEYLHPWEDGCLLGIGYETNPQSGAMEGIKLIMFDISNPMELKEIDSVVIENADYSEALYNYKSVLADKNANLIGFTVCDYGRYDGVYKEIINYLAFSWEGDHFVNLMTEDLGEQYNDRNCRGIYIGEYFYIANTEEILCFDRTDKYRMIDRITLE